MPRGAAPPSPPHGGARPVHTGSGLADGGRHDFPDARTAHAARYGVDTLVPPSDLRAMLDADRANDAEADLDLQQQIETAAQAAAYPGAEEDLVPDGDKETHHYVVAWRYGDVDAQMIPQRLGIQRPQTPGKDGKT